LSQRNGEWGWGAVGNVLKVEIEGVGTLGRIADHGKAAARIGAMRGHPRRVQASDGVERAAPFELPERQQRGAPALAGPPACVVSLYKTNVRSL
jgi:hypothetical protein